MPRYRRALLVLMTASICSIAGQAAVITFTGVQRDFGGTGFGNVLNVLSVQNKNSEYGAVSWNGSADVLSGHATNTSQTVTAADLQAEGIVGTAMFLYFNGNEPGNASSVLLHDFTMNFVDGSGASLFDATYSAPSGGLTISDFGGTGQSGWEFQVTMSPSESALFFALAGNRIGMTIDVENAIGDTAGGAENFFLAPGQGGPGGGGDPVPEPTALAAWGAALAIGWRCRWKRTPNARV